MAAVSAAPEQVTVALFSPKSTSTLSTPSTEASADRTRGGQLTAQVMPVTASETVWLSSIS